MSTESWTIAIVSADPVQRNTLIRHLREAGYSVLEAANLTEAARIAEKFEGEIHATLIDDRPGTLNGFEAGAAVTHFRPGTKIVFSSELGNSESLGELYRPLIRVLQQTLN
jgi:DNA-binding response OmpR family regulator